MEPRNIESAVFTLNTAPYSKVQCKLANKIPARLVKTTSGTTTEKLFFFWKMTNWVVTNFYPYCTLYFLGEGCRRLIVSTSATKQRLVCSCMEYVQ